MDRLLKDRKMASASARRKRIQQRDDIRKEQRQERQHRRRQFSESSGSAAESTRSASPENDSAVETPSEYSARTPDNLSSPEVELNNQTPASSERSSSGLDESNGDHEMGFASARTTLKAGWSSRSDSKSTNFPYYRFSTFIPDPESTDEEEEEEPTPIVPQDSESEYEEDEEPFTPIEIATSVAYSLPKKRPSLISVSNSQTIHRRHKSSLNMLSYDDRPLPLRPQKSVDGFLASEAKPVEYPPLPPKSRARNVSDVASIETTSSRLDEHESAPKRKSSMPMLGKIAHARMNSLKNFIKPPTLMMPDVPQIPSRHQHRPSTAVNDIARSQFSHQSIIYASSASMKHLPIEPRRSLTEPALNGSTTQTTPQTRPQTARTSSQSGFTALPQGNNQSEECRPSLERNEGSGLGRKKSFSSLRRRSGSIGAALKLAPTKPKSVNQESPPPPVPTFVPIPRDTSGVARMPPPPAKSPRLSRGGGYSPFPRTPKMGEPVGLGLKV